MKLFLIISALALLVIISGCTSVDTSTKKDPLLVLEQAMDKTAGADSYSGTFDITYEVAGQKTVIDTKIYKLGSKQRVTIDMAAPNDAKQKGIDRIKVDTFRDGETTTVCYPGDLIISSSKALGIPVPEESVNEVAGKLVCSKGRSPTSISLDPSTTLSRLKSQASSGAIDITYKGLGNVAGRQCDLLGVTSASLIATSDESSQICLDTETGMALQSKLVLFVSSSASTNNPIVTTTAKSFSLNTVPQDIEIPGNVVYSDEFTGALSQVIPTS